MKKDPEDYKNYEDYWTSGTGMHHLEDRWLSWGQSNYKMFCNAVPDYQPKVMVEWGVGGGANIAAFCPKTVYGIDISKPVLDHTTEKYGAIPVFIDIREPESVLDVITESVDFFLSVAVYHHLPNRDYGYRVNKIANQMLKSGGYAMIGIMPGNSHVFNRLQYPMDDFESHLYDLSIVTKHENYQNYYHVYILRKED